MGWVVKAWRAEGLGPLVSEHTRVAAREVREAAERDARAIRRTARREGKRTQGELQRLEHMGSELLQDVRERRAATRGSGGPWPDGPPPPDPLVRHRHRRIRPLQRARLRESPLAELFRATQ